MKNTFGQAITVTLFGESHGAGVGAVIDGLSPGLAINIQRIEEALAKRRPKGVFSTSRVERDPVSLLSGVYQGVTTGAPLCIFIPNEEQNSKDYPTELDTPRPSHADYTAHIKYNGYEDVRGGGRFSGRVTAPLVAVGAILSDALAQHGIFIGTHLLRLGNAEEAPMCATEEECKLLSSRSFPTLTEAAEEKMKAAMVIAAQEGDSVGGVLESTIVGIPAGLGEPFFDSVESVLSHLLFSIGGVKGVEFGLGFNIASRRGSQANDAFLMKDGQVVTATNHSGGVQGGITNGMPVLVRTAIKPPPTIYKEQSTVSLKEGKNVTVSFGGRHDAAIAHRAAAVIDAMLAIGIADLITARYGANALKEGFTCNTD